eukprot:7578675-Alexandrium_andersonii.AAC.1
MIGMRGGMSPDAASWRSALEIEAAMADQDTYCAASADVFKAFDQVSRAHLYCLCLRAGLPR